MRFQAPSPIRIRIRGTVMDNNMRAQARESLSLARASIDELDTTLRVTLAKRFEVVRRIGVIKAHQNSPVIDNKRFTRVIEQAVLHGDSLGLSKNFVQKLYRLIHEEACSIELQECNTLLQNLPIVLVGMPGAGKTTIGRLVATHLSVVFFDTDEVIEQVEGSTVSEIFQKDGETHFRRLEEEIILDLLREGNRVISVGGGAMSNSVVQDAIIASSLCFYLEVRNDNLLLRLQEDSDRPLLRGKDTASILKSLLGQREKAYKNAHITIQNNDSDPDSVATHIASLVNNIRRHSISTRSGKYELICGFGAINWLPQILSNLALDHVAIITDEIVAGFHLQAVTKRLTTSGVVSYVQIISPGERSKNIETYKKVVTSLVNDGVKRRSAIIALGGGVVGDLAGFCSATIYRGIPLIQMPTTLLSLVDSSVGGKTGINLPAGKNLLGAFHQPASVIADLNFLSTLSQRELRAGYAEIIKAAIIAGEEFFSWCEVQGDQPLISVNSPSFIEAVTRAIDVKATLVAQDEQEELKGAGRELLNLGHTFAHAIEAEAGYGNVLHGEAVAIGLVLAASLAGVLEVNRTQFHARLKQVLLNVGLPTCLSALKLRLSASDLLRRMEKDKKNSDARIRFLLPRRPGDIVVNDDVPREVVSSILKVSMGAPDRRGGHHVT